MTDSRRDWQTDRQTELLYQYRTSVCWCAIKVNSLSFLTTPGNILRPSQMRQLHLLGNFSQLLLPYFDSISSSPFWFTRVHFHLLYIFLFFPAFWMIHDNYLWSLKLSILWVSSWAGTPLPRTGRRNDKEEATESPAVHCTDLLPDWFAHQWKVIRYIACHDLAVDRKSQRHRHCTVASVDTCRTLLLHRLQQTLLLVTVASDLPLQRVVP